VAYAKGIGGTRGVEATFTKKRPICTIEQAVLCGGLGALIKLGLKPW